MRPTVPPPAENGTGGSHALSLKTLVFSRCGHRGAGMWFGEPRALVQVCRAGPCGFYEQCQEGGMKGQPCTLISEQQSLFTVITACPFLSRMAINQDTTVHILSDTFPLKSLQASMFNPFPPLSVHSSDPYDAFRHQILCIILKKKICPVQINPPGDRAVCAEGRPAGKRR